MGAGGPGRKGGGEGVPGTPTQKTQLAEDHQVFPFQSGLNTEKWGCTGNDRREKNLKTRFHRPPGDRGERENKRKK